MERGRDLTCSPFPQKCWAIPHARYGECICPSGKVDWLLYVHLFPWGIVPDTQVLPGYCGILCAVYGDLNESAPVDCLLSWDMSTFSPDIAPDKERLPGYCRIPGILAGECLGMNSAIVSLIDKALINSTTLEEVEMMSNKYHCKTQYTITWVLCVKLLSGECQAEWCIYASVD